MNGDRFFNLLGGFITIGVITTIVMHKNTADVIRAGGSAFANMMKSAQGR